MADDTHINIDVVSDVVCPWCYVGQRHLDAALERLKEVSVTVNWRPYQLDPTIPPQGRDRQAYLIAKFGNRDTIDAMHERLNEIGMAAGIVFDFEAIEVSPNTLDAHRLIRWAATQGEAVQNRLVRHLFHLYFERGADIGSRDVLFEAARTSGMDMAVIEALLPTPADRAEVEAEIATAQRMGVTGVPCFLLEGRYALMGAQPPDTLADAIAKIAESKAKGELPDRP